MSMDTTGFADQREELLESIEREQEEVRVAVQELAGAARSAFDLNGYIRSAPLAWTLGAFLVGAWLGSGGISTNAISPKTRR
ncbi:MAG: hypothetical protein SH850_04990 [Planctomycetaceae bacterium]|nr:hypothetical protein [Planctomycetaceae bacterium]